MAVRDIGVSPSLHTHPRGSSGRGAPGTRAVNREAVQDLQPLRGSVTVTRMSPHGRLPSRRYMITSLDRTHAGFYRCIVRNRMGALLQRQTEVQVACK